MNEDLLRKLIQSVKMDEPGLSFSDDLMKTIQAEEDLSLSPEVHRLLKNNLIATPSDTFTRDVMTRLPSKKPLVFAPIIGRQTWQWVAGLVASILLVVIISATANKVPTHAPTHGLFITSFWHKTEQPLFFVAILSTISLLLGGDYWLRYKRNFL
ncbi:MAG: hypothetical protein U0Y10_11805 [Spirosomataceae bacterium]